MSFLLEFHGVTLPRQDIKCQDRKNKYSTHPSSIRVYTNNPRKPKEAKDSRNSPKARCYGGVSVTENPPVEGVYLPKTTDQHTSVNR